MTQKPDPAWVEEERAIEREETAFVSILIGLALLALWLMLPPSAI